MRHLLTLAAAALLPLASSHALEAVAQQPYYQNAGKNLLSDVKLSGLQGRVDALTKELNNIKTALNGVLSTSSSIGTPLYAKIIKLTNYNEYNHIMTTWINKTGIPQADRDYWFNVCLAPDGRIPSSFQDNALGYEYCLRYVCENKIGTKPFMARMAEQCSEGGSPYCNNGKFALHVQCLTELDTSTAQP